MKISDKSFALNFYFELPGTLDWGRFNEIKIQETAIKLQKIIIFNGA